MNVTGRRENFFDTIEHRTPKKLIVDLGGCPLSGLYGSSEKKLLEFLGYSNGKEENIPYKKRINERLLRYLDIDTRSIGNLLKPAKPYKHSVNINESVDEWGITRKFTGKYWDIVENPLRGATVDDLDKYNWPDPESVDIKEIEYYKEQAENLYNNTDYIICAEHPIYGVFELGCWLCGFDDFLMRMATDEAFVYRLFDILLGYQKRIIEIYYGMLGSYIHFTSSGDDFAMQTGLFISPDMFNRMIKPYLKERIDHTKKFTKALFLHHSCGNVFDIIPSLADAGVDILNPIQPACDDMHPNKLKEVYGRIICYHGGIDTQNLLPFSSIEEITEEVRKTAGILGKGGGYILAAAHNIQDDIPPENLIAMFKAAKDVRLR